MVWAMFPQLLFATETNINSEVTEEVTEVENAIEEDIESNSAEAFGIRQPTRNTIFANDIPWIGTPPESSVSLARFFNVVSGSNTFVSTKYPNTVSIIGPAKYQTGAIWAKEKFDLSKEGKVSSYFYLKKEVPHNDSRNADGLTLTFHNDPKGLNAIGHSGQSLGVYPKHTGGGQSGNPRITNSYTFEIDLYLNNDNQIEQLASKASCFDRGINEQFHVGFVNGAEIASQCSNVQKHESYKPLSAVNGFAWEEWVPFDFEWEPLGANSGKMTVTLGNEEFVKVINDVDSIFGTTNEDKTVYWGYTASTGMYAAFGAISVESLPQQPTVDLTMRTINREGELLTDLFSRQEYTYEIDVEEVSGIGAFDGPVVSELTNNIEYKGNAIIKYSDGTVAQIPDADITIVGNKISFGNLPSIMNDSYTITFDVAVKAGRAGEFATNTVSASHGHLDYTPAIESHEIINAAPVISLVDSVVVLPLDAAAPNVLFGVSANDDIDGDLTSQITFTGTVNTAVKGIYPIVYNVIDSDNRSAASVTRNYVVGANGVGVTHAIYADSFSIQTNAVMDDSRIVEKDQQIITESGAYAVSLTSGQIEGQVVVVDSGNYTNESSEYDIVLGVVEDPAALVQIGAYVFDVIDTVNKKAINAQNFSAGIAAVGTEAQIIAKGQVQVFDISSAVPTEITATEIIKANPTNLGLGLNQNVTYTVENTSLSKTIVANIFADIDENLQLAITAADFNARIHEVETEAQIIAKGQVKVYDISNYQLTDITDNVQINASPASLTEALGQQITYTVSGTTLNKTVTANIFSDIDENTKTALIANDFTAAFHEVQTASNIIQKGNVKVYNILTTPPTDITALKTITVNPSGLQVGTGQTVTYKVKNTALNKMVTADIIESNILLTANSVALTLEQAQQITSSALITKAGATAQTIFQAATITINITPSEMSKLTSLASVPVAPVTITIEATDTTGDRTTKTIEVRVFDDIDPITNKALMAFDFNAKVDEVQTTSGIIAKGQVAVYDITNPATPVDITANETILASPTALSAGLGQQVTYAVVNTSLSKNVEANIFADIDENNAKALEAYDFDAEISAVRSEEELVKKGQVKVYDITSGTPIDITANEIIMATPTSLGLGVGQQVTYTVANTTLTREVTANIFTNIDLGSGKALMATNFNAKFAGVQTADGIINRGQVKVYDLQTPIPTDITATEIIQVAPEKLPLGLNQNVTYTVENTTLTKTVVANVLLDIDEALNQGLTASNFNAELTDVQTASDLINKGQVRVYDLSGAMPIDITGTAIIHANPTRLRTGLNQTVTYTVENTTMSKSVLANVFNDIDPVANKAIIASDFNAKVADVQTAAQIIAKGQVKVYDVTSFAVVEITGQETIYASRTSLQVGIGQVVTYTVRNTGLGKTVVANIFDDVDEQKNKAITANNFSASRHEVQTESGIIAKGQVRVYDLSAIIPIDITATETIIATPRRLPVGNGQEVTYTVANTQLVKKVTVNIIASNIQLTANDVAMTLADAQSLNAARLISRTNATAITTNFAAVTTIYINNDEIKKLTDLREVPQSPISITIGATDTDGDETTITISVSVFTNIDFITNRAINAVNFNAELSEIQTEAGLIAKGQVQVFNINNPANPINITANEHIFANPTSLKTGLNQNVTYTVAGTSLSKTVLANVFLNIDSDLEKALIATDFNAELSEVQTESDIIAKGQAKVYDISGVVPVDITATERIRANPTTLQLGLNQVVHYTVERTNLGQTVVANVLSDIDNITNKAIIATDFNAELAEVQTERDIIAKGQVRIYDVTTTDPVDITASEIIRATPRALALGLEQTVTYTVENTNLSKEITANILSIIDNVTNKAIMAVDFNAEIEQVQTENQIITKGQVKVYDITTTDLVDITATETIRATPTKLGMGLGQQVLYTVENTALRKIVTANIFLDLDEETNRAITAVSFNAELEEVQNEAAIIAKGQVRVYNVASMNLVDITESVEIRAIPTRLPVGLEQIVTYAVTSTTLRKDVIANVFDDIDEGTNRAITATNFNAELADVQTEAQLITNANVKVYAITDGGRSTDITASEVIRATPKSLGVGLGQVVNYEVENTQLRTFATANVFVEIDEQADKAIIASDFNAKASEVQIVDDIIAKGKVAVYDVSTTNPINITNSSVIRATPTTLFVGIGQPVVYRVENTTLNKSVIANIFDDVDLTTNKAIIASDFNAELSEVQNEAAIIARGQVNIYNIETTTPVNITNQEIIHAAPTRLSIGNNQKVTYRVENTSLVKQVIANVFDHLDYENNLAIVASDFSAELEEVQNESGIIAKGQVKVYSIETMIPTEVNQNFVIRATPTMLRTGVGQSVIYTVENTSLSKSVVANIFDLVDTQTNKAMTASGFTAKLADVETTKQIIEQGRVRVYDIGNSTPIDITGTETINVTPNTLKLGVRQVLTYSVAGTSLSKVVSANIFLDIDEEANKAISAYDFTATYHDVRNESGIINQGRVTVYNLTTGQPANITAAEQIRVNPGRLGLGANQGVIFTVEGTRLAATVSAEVIDTDVYEIISNNIYLDIDTYNQLTSANALETYIRSAAGIRVMNNTLQREAGQAVLDISSLQRVSAQNYYEETITYIEPDPIETRLPGASVPEDFEQMDQEPASDANSSANVENSSIMSERPATQRISTISLVLLVVGIFLLIIIAVVSTLVRYRRQKEE
jgi:hypothetical protein